MPRRQETIGIRIPDDYFAECILLKNHNGPHIIKTPDDKYFAWEDDLGCGCEDCMSDDSSDHCFIYWEVHEKDIQGILKGQA